MKKIAFILLASMFVSSCQPNVDQNETSGRENYAKHFSIDEKGKFTLLNVINPWQKARNENFHYVFNKGEPNLPDSLYDYVHIKIPVKKVIALSTTHVGFISALEEEMSIVGVSGEKYIYNPKLRKRIEDELVRDVGYAPAIDYESIVQLDPDVVLLYGLESSVMGIVQRLKKVGIPAILIGEYLEQHPLGKLEWIRVMGALYDKTERAEIIFNQSVKEYMSLKDQVLKVEEKPNVFMGLPWKDTWYMAGGESFSARLISDAGGNYLWKDNSSDEYIPLALESVFQNALTADVWINSGDAGSLTEVSNRDERFTMLPAFQNKNVYNNDALTNAYGGNDFWESGVVQPHIVLKDLIKIFHPELLNKHEFVYYRKLE